MNWCFENTGFRAGDFNMRYDERLAQEVALGARPPTVRVYGWDPPTISLGWNQSPKEIDADAAAEAAIDVVRRPTGGRAILHSDELTYSVVMPADGKSVGAVYHEISRALVRALEHVGVVAQLEKSQPHFPTLYQSPSGAACFTSSARYEIKVNGRKLVGSAQRRFFYGGVEVILQHGSILLGLDHRRIADFLLLSDEEERAALRQELEMKTTDLKSIPGSSGEFEDVAEAIRRGFEHAWSIHFQPPPILSTQYSAFITHEVLQP